MTAIISNHFRLNAAKEMVDDAVNNSSYYLFVGRSEPWDSETSPDAPYDNTFSYHTDAWQRMTAMKEITDLTNRICVFKFKKLPIISTTHDVDIGFWLIRLYNH